MKDQIKFVDHEIQHDGDVGASVLKWRESPAFDETGAVEVRFRGPKRWIEPFDVPHLELDPGFGRRGDECIGLGQRSGQRFFHEDGDAALERRESNGGVVRGRDRDRYRTHPAQEGVKIGKAPNSDCGFNFATARSSDVVETYELDFLQAREMPGMVQAEHTNADNANG
jgi:hypothetical protein